MKFYKIASAFTLILGLGHNITSYLMTVPDSMTTVLNQMKMAGTLGMNLYDMNQGFSYAMGFLLISIGLMGLTVKEVKKVNISINIVTMLIVFIISAFNFFIVPQIISLLAVVFYTLSYKKDLQWALN